MLFCFFFSSRRRHTRLQGDWSSDVCSSDLGKLEEKWKGPYYIHVVAQNGSYKIRDMQGKVLKAPVNTSLLKPYHSRHNWTPTVVINHGEIINCRRNSGRTSGGNSAQSRTSYTPL